MLEGHIARCIERIAEEEALAREASCTDAALVHTRTAMILKSEVSVLQHRQASSCRVASVGQMLAELF